MSASQTLSALWAQRTGSEREAAGRFRRLASDLEVWGAHGDLVAVARQAQRDESFHARLCARMARRYETNVELPDLRAPQAPRDAAPSADRLLLDVISMCCVTESVNAALLAYIHDTATDGLVRRVTRRILKDEVRHSRVGWAYLDWERNKRDLRGLSAVLPRLLDAIASDDLRGFSAPAGEDPALRAHGAPSFPMLSQIFRATMTSVVFPGLESSGIDTAEARIWLDEQLPLLQ